jgi:hypothetical protein
MTEHLRISGFLVVLEPKVSRNTGKLYAGVGRMPPYPSKEPAEALAIDEYVFGGVKDFDTNVIPSLGAAVRLCNMLHWGSRRLEIIYCRDGDQPFPRSELEIETPEQLGYDVATVRTGYWSIVDDISPSDWAISYRRLLNGNGLFSSLTDAEDYLRDYRAHKEMDADFPFDVVEVIRIKPRPTVPRTRTRWCKAWRAIWPWRSG